MSLAAENFQLMADKGILFDKLSSLFCYYCQHFQKTKLLPQLISGMFSLVGNISPVYRALNPVNKCNVCFPIFFFPAPALWTQSEVCPTEFSLSFPLWWCCYPFFLPFRYVCQQFYNYLLLGECNSNFPLPRWVSILTFPLVVAAFPTLMGANELWLRNGVGKFYVGGGTQSR